MSNANVQFNETEPGHIEVTYRTQFVGIIKRLEDAFWKFSGPGMPCGFTADNRSECKRLVEDHYSM